MTSASLLALNTAISFWKINFPIIRFEISKSGLLFTNQLPHAEDLASDLEAENVQSAAIESKLDFGKWNQLKSGLRTQTYNSEV